MRKLLLALLILSILIISSCSNNVPGCEKPYIVVGERCCLDRDNNGVCDSDETTCRNECSVDSCIGFDYYSCLMKPDGCRDRENQGRVRDRCGVECLNNNDCNENEKCVNARCKFFEPTVRGEVSVKGFCGDSICQETETCSSCAPDCGLCPEDKINFSEIPETINIPAWSVYTDPSYNFSFEYPENWVVDVNETDVIIDEHDIDKRVSFRDPDYKNPHETPDLFLWATTPTGQNILDIKSRILDEITGTYNYEETFEDYEAFAGETNRRSTIEYPANNFIVKEDYYFIRDSEERTIYIIRYQASNSSFMSHHVIFDRIKDTFRFGTMEDE